MNDTRNHPAARATAVLAAVAALGALSMHLALGGDPPLVVAVAAWALYGGALGTMAWFGIIAPLIFGLASERRARTRAEVRIAAERRRRRLVARIEGAVEEAQSEPELVELVGRAMNEVFAERDNSILLCRGDDGRVVWSLPVTPDGLGTPVELDARPRCSSLRTRQITTAQATNEIGACPHGAGFALASSVCIPIAVGDGFIGVATSAGAPGELPHDDDIEILERACRRIGSRIAEIRSQRDARVDRSRGELDQLPDHRDALRVAVDDIAGGTRCAVALCDIDDFSGYNTRHGREAGDRALELYVAVVDATLRPTDVIARYDADRFVCILSSCTAPQAASAMERLREALVLALAMNEIAPFHFSVGVADSASGGSVEGIVEAADVALTVAKQAGGNRVQIAEYSDAGFGEPDQ